MNRETVKQEFILPLRKFFQPPDVPDPPEFWIALADDLAGYSVERLQAGVKHIRQNRKARSFPSIGECVAACRGTKADAPPERAYVFPWEIQPGDLLARTKLRKRACALCRCSLGRQADDEGWLPALIEFAETHDRMPEGREIGSLRASADRAENAIDGAGADLAPVVARFRKAMLVKASRDVWRFEFGEAGSVLQEAS